MPQSYKQRFRKDWLTNVFLKDWLVEIPTDPLKVGCRFCKNELRAKYNDLLNHAKSLKHQKKSVLSTNEVIEYVIQIEPSSSATYHSSHASSCSFETARLECRLALFAASHTTSIDHLADILRNSVTDGVVVSDLTINEEKCSDIIKNILSVHFLKDLAEDIGDGYFSLILDESNLSIDNMLGVVIIYYSRHQNKVVSTFFTLVQLQECSVYGIIEALKDSILRRNLNFKQLIGIATDNQNNMVEINSELYNILKTEIPTLIFLRCICNSIRSAISYASVKRLPKNLEYLIAETYKWFSIPTSRQYVYADLYKSLNVAETVLKLHDDLRFRWLTNEMAVGKIIEQWAKLKQHFEVALNRENCYTSEVLCKIYEDETNITYLLFYYSILVEVQMVNNLFESMKVDKVKLLDDLTLLIQSTASKLLLPTARVNVISSDIEEFLDPNPRLEYKFERKILELRNCNKITEDGEMHIRENCRQFLLTLFEQLKQRLPYNLDILRRISALSVSKALHPLKEPIVNLMEMLGSSEEDISAAEIQWPKLHLINWNNQSDTEAFWNEVLQYKDESESNPFEELSQFASKVLILPHSNDEVEKIFSCVKMARSKVKNEVDLKMQNALLDVKFGLSRHNKCCNTYTISEDSVNAVMILGENQSDPSTSISTFANDIQNLFNSILT